MNFEMKYNIKEGFSIHSDSAITIEVLDIAEKTVKVTGEFLLKLVKAVTE